MAEPLRDAKGHWLPGQPSPNPGGRPKNDSARMIRAAVDEALTPERAMQIADTLVRRAAIGDWKAREQLFKLLGVNEPETFDVSAVLGMRPDDFAATFELVKQRLEERKAHGQQTG